VTFPNARPAEQLTLDADVPSIQDKVLAALTARLSDD
jgi:hypothetical protein